MRDRRVEKKDPAEKGTLDELHELERNITFRSLSEAIRLLESEKFDQLTAEHLRTIAEYGPVEIGDEWFFEKAFTTGKEVAGSLGYAKHIGREVVLDDLRRLRASAVATEAHRCDPRDTAG
jgi:hypothetical protein